MGIDHIGGLDHVVILVADLDRAAAAWAELGFTISPRGLHSAYKGTGNHTMMLGPDYLELLGILTETEPNAADRAGLAEFGEGIDRAAFRTDDAAGALAALAKRGLEGRGPNAFSRPVSLPDGQVAEAAFRTFEWPQDMAPGGLRIFACQHLTPETVWVPSLQSHPNGALSIARLEILSEDPESEAAELADLTGASPVACPDGAWRVPSASDRADFVFLDPSLLATRHPGISVVDARPSGAAALVLKVADLNATLAAVPSAVRVAENRASVPASRATGVILAFEQA